MGNINIDEIADDLHKRIQQEVDKILKKLFTNYRDAKIKRVFYPDDPYVLAVYKLNDVVIFVVRISSNNMGIEFDVPVIMPPRALGDKQDPLKME